MQRFLKGLDIKGLDIRGLGAAALLSACVIVSACSGSPGSATSALKGGDGSGTGVVGLTAVMPPDAPPGITNDSPMARPASVAWTAARAKRCGFYFDPDKLRSNYLGFEGRQPGQDFAKVQSIYDSTYKLILEKTTSDTDYCSDKRSRDIKAELTRHLAGDFSPGLPKPTMVANCGMFGCAKPEGKIEAKQFYKDLDRKQGQ